jgi:rod shape-determining protein MreB
MLAKQIGVDLGTVNLLVAEVNKGIIFREPSVVAIVEEKGTRLMAVGREAKEMYGRTPDAIEVMRPLRDGVIADYEVTEAMLRYFINKVSGPIRLFKPRVMVSVPYGVTSVESRAVREAALQAGAREAYLIPEPLAAAIGAGLPVGTPTGNMVVNMGGGASEAAVVAMNGIVCADIISYVRKKYNLMIGEPTAEQIKIQIGSALTLDNELSMEVQGRDQVAGLPKTITITSGEVSEALTEPLSAIVGMVKSVLEKTPPELAADIIDRGMALCGGSALLRKVDVLLTRETGVPAYVAERPMDCTALGASRALAEYQILRRTIPVTP